ASRRCWRRRAGVPPPPAPARRRSGGRRTGAGRYGCRSPWPDVSPLLDDPDSESVWVDTSRPRYAESVKVTAVTGTGSGAWSAPVRRRSGRPRLFGVLGGLLLRLQLRLLGHLLGQPQRQRLPGRPGLVVARDHQTLQALGQHARI